MVRLALVLLLLASPASADRYFIEQREVTFAPEPSAASHHVYTSLENVAGYATHMAAPDGRAVVTCPYGELCTFSSLAMMWDGTWRGPNGPSEAARFYPADIAGPDGIVGARDYGREAITLSFKRIGWIRALWSKRIVNGEFVPL